jgi:hypothetical protein
MNIIVIIILLILIILFNDSVSPDLLEKESQETKEIEKLIFNDSFNKYRLGDVFKWPLGETEKHHTTSFPGSIADAYIKQSTKTHDMDTLLRIVNERKDNSIITPDLVIHIRIGDIMCNMLWRYGRECYSAYGNTKWWDNVIDIVKKENIKSIGIIAGAHFKQCLGISARYLLNRKKFLENKLNIPVTFYLGRSPDEDLVFGINAKYYISTGGGYGKLIGELVENNGGKFLLSKTCIGGGTFYFKISILTFFVIFLFVIIKYFY